MADFGKLPNFFVIGAAKAGTTTLHDVLARHPQAYVSRVKEPMFFNREEHFAGGVDWYERMFFARAAGSPARGEATPHYLYWSEKVSKRLEDLYAGREPRFIVCLRDPVARAYSWYWNMVREGREELSFAEALEAEPGRLAERARWLDEQGSMLYGHFEGGRYATKLGPFLKRFPRESFLFVLQDDLKRDLAGTVARVFGFLDIDETVEASVSSSNRASMPRFRVVHRALRERSAAKEVVKKFLRYSVRSRMVSGAMRLKLKETTYPPMEAGVERELRRRYEDEVLKLQEIVGRDLSRWLPGR